MDRKRDGISDPFEREWKRQAEIDKPVTKPDGPATVPVDNLPYPLRGPLHLGRDATARNAAVRALDAITKPDGARDMHQVFKRSDPAPPPPSTVVPVDNLPRERLVIQATPSRNDGWVRDMWLDACERNDRSTFDEHRLRTAEGLSRMDETELANVQADLEAEAARFCWVALGLCVLAGMVTWACIWWVLS